MRSSSLLCLAGVLLAFCAAPFAAHAESCAALAALSLPDTTITKAATVPAGSFQPPYGKETPGLPAFCRVTGVLHPTSDSVIRFEVWLPASGWNHRFVGTGNGGFGGSIYYEQMAGNLRHGYATAGTDAGHQADSQDASWAYRHPEKIVDFGWRALHLTTDRAKTIVGRFYGGAPKASYLDACSDGGREALMEAQRFPEDYDGILAGAPANDWTHLMTAGLAVGQVMLKDPAGYIPSPKLPAITEAVLAECDGKDGLKDGILNDPRQCSFKPSTLLCKGGDELSCLTAPQVRTLAALYGGGRDAEGRVIAPGLMPGDEAGAWKSWITGESAGLSNYTQNFFRYMVLQDATWDGLTASVDASEKAAEERMGRALDANDPDLRKFAARGGKLMIYHGWNDPAISPLHTIAYYGQVQQVMGTDAAAKSVRLYVVPGMEHCAGGPGPSAFGQLGLPAPGTGALDALQGWVEDGKAPGSLVAAKFGAAGKVEMTRPVCPYPQHAQYNGTGDAKDAGSFRCMEGGTAQ